MKFAVDYTEGVEIGHGRTSLIVKTTLGYVIFKVQAEQDNSPLEMKFAKLSDGGGERPVIGIAIDGNRDDLSQPLIVRLREI